MSGLTRWRLATPLVILSLLCLSAVILGARLYWSVDGTAERTLTVLAAIMFTANLLLSISIGADRRIQQTPWVRLGIVITLFALSCFVGMLRESL